MDSETKPSASLSSLKGEIILKECNEISYKEWIQVSVGVQKNFQGSRDENLKSSCKLEFDVCYSGKWCQKLGQVNGRGRIIIYIWK